MTTASESYWNQHTVRTHHYKTKEESEQNIHHRNHTYRPQRYEFLRLNQKRSGQVVLDYGCGPGDETLLFAHQHRAQKVYAADVSDLAHTILKQRLSLYSGLTDAVECVRVFDNKPNIPLKDQSIDYIHSAGVLHHTSHPQEILSEFYRILKPGAQATVMVYNYNSVWLHLFVAYVRMVQKKHFQGLNVREAFSKTCDGENCPIAHIYKPQEFTAMCEKAGFVTKYVGGFISEKDLNLWDKNPGDTKTWQEYRKQALDSPLLAQDHKDFLQNLTEDIQGHPLYQGLSAGIGGSYWLEKTGSLK